LIITVYAIRSKIKNYIYVGMTNDVVRRISDHNNGRNKSTKAYRPFELFFSETFGSRGEARMREVYLKSGIGKDFLRSLLK
jgi:putative endonuclease